MANSIEPDQTAPIGEVCSWSMLFASILNSSVMLSNYLQRTTSADDIFRCICFLGVLRDKKISVLRVVGLQILGRVGTYIFFSGKNIILCLLKGISPFKMHKIPFFPEKLSVVR